VDSLDTLVRAHGGHPDPGDLETRPSADGPTARFARHRFRDVPVEDTDGEPAERDGSVEETLVLGRYRLLERLGAGGFGVVWRAHDELLHREVAVKRIALGAGGDPIDGERAAREALAGARLAHPAIVVLHEACAARDAFYLISELIHGDTLAELIAADALSDEELLEIGLVLTDALVHAHARGVIHRDVKPQNVLVPREPLERGGVAKLADFGGARLTGEDALTRAGDVLGTLAYMAPEQSEGREAAEPADLYALALVLYEGLAGDNPVRGPTPAATARRIGSRLEPLERRRGDLPRALTRAIDRALLPDPAQRGELEDLHTALEGALVRGLRRTRRGARRRGLLPTTATTTTPREADPNLGLDPDTGPYGDGVLGHEPSWRGALPQGSGGRQFPIEDDRGLDRAAEQEPPAAPARRLALPRAVWLGCTLAAIVWQAAAGRPGVALLLLAAAAPLILLPRRPGLGWLAAVLAPALGTVGLAAAFPALAGQRARLSERAALAALGYWWLTLAAPLLDRRLWLGIPAGTPARAVWEGSLGAAATHVVGPSLSLGVLYGTAVWALAAMLLPWVVRGRSAVLDVLAASAWSLALLLACVPHYAGYKVSVVSATPRDAVIGALLGGAFAVAARALRGPV
jgi:eukaryotic-like serine/threonine-protein kinase